MKIHGNVLSGCALRILIHLDAALLLALLLGMSMGARWLTGSSPQWLSSSKQWHIRVNKACCEALKWSQTFGSKFLTFVNWGTILSGRIDDAVRGLHTILRTMYGNVATDRHRLLKGMLKGEVAVGKILQIKISRIFLKDSYWMSLGDISLSAF